MDGRLDIALSILVPYAICYLVHTRTSRVWRLALLPIGYFGALRVVQQVRHNAVDASTALGITSELVILHLSCATRWAVARSPPTYEPRSETPYFHGIRDKRWFQAVSLMLNGHRHVGIRGHTPQQPQGKSYIRYLLHHVAWLMFHLVPMQEINAAIVILSTPLGHVGSDPDLLVLLNQIAGSTGIPAWVWRLPCTFLLACWLHAVMALWYHGLALLGLLSGLWTGEEFPRLMDWPIKSDSLGELWGKRYHQWNRDLYTFWAEPARKLGKDIWIMAVFLVSNAQHSLVYPLSLGDTSSIWPWAYFLVGSGIGLVIERRYYKITGRKVGGWPGRVWMWTWLGLVSEPLTFWFWRYLIDTGSVEGSRRHSAVAWLAYAAGVAPKPA